MNTDIKQIIENHQKLTIPIIGKYVRNRRLLDAGCGNGVNSYLFNQKFKSDVTLLDVEDLREDEAKAFPFIKSGIDTLPFNDKSFDVAFLQYVIHHLPPEIAVDEVLRELGRVSEMLIIVEEIFTNRTNRERAKAFDAKMNKILHPDSQMKTYVYYTDEKVKAAIIAAGLNLAEEKIIDEGSEEDGYLQRKIYIINS